MPKQQQRKVMRRKRRPLVNKPRPQPSATTSIVRGLSGIANQFIPGSGLAVRGISKLLGFGAYTTEDAEKILASRVPSMNATLDRGVRVAHHEFLGDVVSSTGFSTKAYPINPGLPETFPWLSSVASAFQEYEINGLIFFFKATSANALNSTNTALGQIIGAVQYNPYMTIPTTKVEMLGLASASDGKPSESNIYPVECKADMVLFRSKLVRWSGVTDDLAKYDHGTFILGSNGSQAASTVGELHVVYDIMLKKPKLWSTVGAAWMAKGYALNPLSATPLGAGLTMTANNLAVTTDSTSITIPAINAVAGTKYYLRLAWTGSTQVTWVPPGVTYGNALASPNDFYTGGSAVHVQYCPEQGAVAKQCMLSLIFTVVTSNTPVVITLGTSGAIPTTTTSVDVCLTEAV